MISSRIDQGLLGNARDMFRLLKFHWDHRSGFFFLSGRSAVIRLLNQKRKNGVEIIAAC